MDHDDDLDLEPVGDVPPVGDVDELGSSLSTSIVRTVVPLVVGWIVSELPFLDESSVSSIVAPLVAGLYYTAARFLEEKLGPAWGWLLGRPSAPTYSTK